MAREHLEWPAEISKWSGRLIGLAVLAIGPVAIFGGKGIVVVLAFGGSAALVDLTFRGRLAEIFLPIWLIGIGAGAFLLALASAALFPELSSNFSLMLRLMALCILGLALRAWMSGAGSGERDRLGISLVAGICIAIILSSVFQLSLHFGEMQLWGSNPLDRMASIKPGASIISLAIWPAAVFLWQRGRRRLSPVFFALSLIAVSPAYSALVAVAVGGAAFLLIRLRGRLTRNAIGLVCMIIVLTMPILFLRVTTPTAVIGAMPSLSDSAKHRLYIWQFTSQRIAEKPFVGWGFDGSRSIPGGRDPAPVGDSLLPLHPHNAALQVWLELGLTGALLASLFIGAVFIAPSASGAERPVEAARHAMIVTLFGNALMSFGIWQNWWFATLWLLPAVFTGVCGSLNVQRSSDLTDRS
jgi:exopolysaccharide production protein ExoQ